MAGFSVMNFFFFFFYGVRMAAIDLSCTSSVTNDFTNSEHVAVNVLLCLSILWVGWPWRNKFTKQIRWKCQFLGIERHSLFFSLVIWILKQLSLNAPAVYILQDKVTRQMKCLTSARRQQRLFCSLPHSSVPSTKIFSWISVKLSTTHTHLCSNTATSESKNNQSWIQQYYTLTYKTHITTLTLILVVLTSVSYTIHTHLPVLPSRCLEVMSRSRRNGDQDDDGFQ